MRDAEQDVFDLAGAELGIQLMQRRGTPEGAVGLMEPPGRLHSATEDILGQSRNPTQAEEPVRFVRAQPLLALSSGERSGRHVEHRDEVGRADLEARGDGLEGRVGEAGPELRLQPLKRHAFALEDASPPKGLGNPLGSYHLSVTSDIWRQVYCQMASKTSTIPIIMVTGSGDVELERRAVEAGAVRILKKPVEPTALLDAVREAVGEPA